LLWGKMTASGEDPTTKRSRRVVPRRREVSEILTQKFYQVFDLLEVGSRTRGNDVIEVEKGRHENAALS